MYRLLQALEREPNHRAEGGDVKTIAAASKRSNPHKYLLYRPAIGVLLNYISIGYKDLNDHAAMLLYLSADGIKMSNKNDFGYVGGVATMNTSANAAAKRLPESSDGSGTSAQINSHCLYPQDLSPFTRKPMFVVVDSNNSAAFKDLSSVFGKPLVTLLSPAEHPSSLKDISPLGSLFTLFLHSPLKAFLLLQSISQVANQEAWKAISQQFATMESNIEDLLHKNMSNYSDNVTRFLQDDFTRTLIVRYILSLTVLKAHEVFNDPLYLPSSNVGSEIDALSDENVLVEGMQAVLIKTNQLGTSE